MTLIASALLLAGSLLQLPHAVATFEGTFKSIDKKFVEVQVESGETMRMYTTHSTKYVRDGHAAKPADFHEGEKVAVDAERDLRLNLLAVKVELMKPKLPK